MGMELCTHGRRIDAEDLAMIRSLMEKHPKWHRTRLSEEVCRAWQWFNEKGQLRDIACRTILLRLERQGLIRLPPPRRKSNNERRNRSITFIEHDTEVISGSLNGVRPLTLYPLQRKSFEDRLFNCLVSRYHYLGHRSSAGENLKYLVQDANGRPLACLLFDAAAWKTAARDRFIGWSRERREKQLRWLTNNSRFLILPWIRIKHLASHVLGCVQRRLADDWTEKYGHPVYLVETFVDTSRFQGTCYRAANWICVGISQGRTRNDRHHRISMPPKAVYVYPLRRDFRRRLSDDA
jgi:hypothetical protein